MNPNKLHFVYLIPSDKTNTTESAIERAALHMQAWCRWQMGNNKTFTLTNPIVTVRQTIHTADWYSTHIGDDHPPHAELFWANTQTDARDYAGAGFYQEHDSWVIYIDAPTAPDQHAGGASVNGSGLCVLPAKDCASIRGQDPDWTLCRGIGGGLHEALHTLGLPHPPPGSPDWSRAVMGYGYGSYPNAILTENDKVTLDHHRFFDVQPKRPKPNVCPFHDERPQRPPRPRPLPVIRP